MNRVPGAWRFRHVSLSKDILGKLGSPHIYGLRFLFLYIRTARAEQCSARAAAHTGLKTLGLDYLVIMSFA